MLAIVAILLMLLFLVISDTESWQALVWWSRLTLLLLLWKVLFRIVLGRWREELIYSTAAQSLGLGSVLPWVPLIPAHHCSFEWPR